MKILKIESSFQAFYCPATGQNLIGPDGECMENVKSVKGFWLDMFFDDPIIKCKEMEVAWGAECDRQAGEDDQYFPDLVPFLEGYDRPNWAAFELASQGPDPTTAWYVLDLGTCSDNLKLD